MNDYILEVENLTVRLDDQLILDRLSYDVKFGEIVAIIGPNGSGKTTMLRAILGLIPYEGSVTIMGGPAKLVFNRIGYVPQKFSFDKTFPLTVREFLAFIRPVKEEWRDEVFSEVGITAFLYKRIGELSGGQLQRVLIAKALLREPELLLLDEATAGVDIAAEMTFFDLIEHLNKTHRLTIMLISHEVSMVYDFANKILCLNKDVVCYGTPDQAVTQEVLEKLYGKGITFRPHEH